jgi:hypothetical protein
MTNPDTLPPMEPSLEMALTAATALSRLLRHVNTEAWKADPMTTIPDLGELVWSVICSLESELTFLVDFERRA